MEGWCRRAKCLPNITESQKVESSIDTSRNNDIGILFLQVKLNTRKKSVKHSKQLSLEIETCEKSGKCSRGSCCCYFKHYKPLGTLKNFFNLCITLIKMKRKFTKKNRKMHILSFFKASGTILAVIWSPDPRSCFRRPAQIITWTHHIQWNLTSHTSFILK